MSEQRAAQRFDSVADGYDEANANWPPERMVERITALASPAPSDIVLDIGTGTGRLAIALAPLATRVVGIDVSEKMLAHAREKANRLALRNIEFRHGSFVQPNLAEAFNIIVSSLAFEWIPDQEKRVALDSMSALLVPSGRVVLGERMLFVDPQTEPERASDALFDLVSQVTGKSTQEVERTIPPTLLPEHLNAARRFRAQHQELHLRPEKLARLFRERGFDVDKIEEVTPLLGIIVARKLGI